MRKFVLVVLTFIMVLTAGCFTFGGTKEKSNNVYYKSIAVVYGDTLWNIAEEYKNEDMSTIEYVTLIKDFNNMKNDKIKAGEKIIIPVYEF